MQIVHPTAFCSGHCSLAACAWVAGRAFQRGVLAARKFSSRRPSRRSADHPSVKLTGSVQRTPPPYIFVLLFVFVFARLGCEVESSRERKRASDRSGEGRVPLYIFWFMNLRGFTTSARTFIPMQGTDMNSVGISTRASNVTPRKSFFL